MTRTKRLSTPGLAALLLPVALVIGACGESTTEPRLEISAVAGTYTMTALRFDPQGSLPESNILPVLGDPPTLTLTSAGQAQVVMRDPVTTLVVTIQGTFQTTPTGVRVDFASQSAFRQLLLSARMEFAFSEQAGTLSFAANAPDGVSRARLVELVPALATEQLLDPTPGALTVTFTRLGLIFLPGSTANLVGVRALFGPALSRS